jgi:4-hydroxy-4-methyl-2-oxoglutarate aldolase
MTTEDPDLAVLAQQVSTADIVDAMGRLHRHRCQLLDLVSPTPGRLLFGPAVTISYFPSCDVALPPDRYNFGKLFDEAVSDGGMGRVLVLASNGHPDVSMAGGTKLSRLARHNLAGVLTDARLRDFAELSSYGFTAYCRGEALHWGGDVVTPFEANRPVVVHGVAVRPGDYVFADASGAAVIPHVQVRTVLQGAVSVASDDAATVKALLDGDQGRDGSASER